VLGALAGTAYAQAADEPSLRRHEIVVSGGLVWSGGYAIGDSTARLRSNATGSAPPPFTLFATSAAVKGALGVEARLGVAVTRSFAIEAGGAFSRPTIAVALSRDPEAAPQTLAGESLQQFAFDVGAVWQLPVRLGERLRPFASGGAGYLRQLHEERTLVETGQIYYVGAGLRHWLRGGAGTARSIGVRGELRATWRRGAIDFENRTRAFPSAALFLFVGL
jgi:opacity protein-like surface antigen